MDKKLFVLAALTLFTSLSTFAQNCPQGIPQGTPSCVPPDQLGYSTAPPVNTAYWKKLGGDGIFSRFTCNWHINWSF